MSKKATDAQNEVQNMNDQLHILKYLSQWFIECSIIAHYTH